MQVGSNWDLGLVSKIFYLRTSCLQPRCPYTTFPASLPIHLGRLCVGCLHVRYFPLLSSKEEQNDLWFGSFKFGSQHSSVTICIIVILQCCSATQSCPALCDLVDCSTPGSPSFTNSQNLLLFMSMESVMLSNHLILCCSFSFGLHSFPAWGSFPMSQLLWSQDRSSQKANVSFPGAGGRLTLLLRLWTLQTMLGIQP